MVAHNGLEPDDGKLSCPVLRGQKGGNTLSYPIILTSYLFLINGLQRTSITAKGAYNV